MLGGVRSFLARVYNWDSSTHKTIPKARTVDIWAGWALATYYDERTPE